MNARVSRPARPWLAAVVVAVVLCGPVLFGLVESRSALAASPTVPAGFSDSLFASGFGSRLTAMDFAPDGRLFVSEKSGAVRVVKNGALLATPFLTVIPYNSNERGLLGITFDPNFATNGQLYLFYTMRIGSGPIHNRVSRFTASSSNPDVAESGSEFVLIDDIASQTGAHNGGAIHFGPDGKLYITVGDSATAANAQDMTILAGKVLRLNADGSIPSDNPFVGQAGKRPEIWAYGVRNPYTFAFQPGTGRMFINDVGNNGWEEINEGFAGANYGWPTCEGSCSVAGMTNPIYQYPHNGGSAAITGAVFANTSTFPTPYKDSYYFGDYVGNWIKRYDMATQQVTAFATDTPFPVDLRIGADGALYYLAVETSEIHRIAYGGAPPPPPPTPTPPPVGDPPVGVIDSPAGGTTYRAGDTISFAGSATDTEDGALGAARLTWEVVFHHGTHTHPFVDPFSGQTSGSFQIPTFGEAAADTWYRIHLRVQDSDGNISETTRDVTPRTSTFTLATDPAGLSLTLDGQPQSTPTSVLGVPGFVRSLDAPASQVVGGVTYTFDAWSDGGARSHTIATPDTATTYSARYAPTGATELLRNTSFESTGTAWLSPWKWVVKSGASGSITQDTTTVHSGLRAARVTNNTVTTDSNLQLQQPGNPLVNGTLYTVSFWAKSSASRTIAVAIHQTASPYKRYIQKTISLTTAWTRFSFQYQSTVDMPDAMLVFSFAAATGQIFLDDASLTRPDTGPPAPPPPPPPPPPANLLVNPGFESVASGWLSPWTWKLRSPAVAAVTHSSVRHSGAYSAQVDVTTASTDWYVQIIQGKFAVTGGVRYTVSFWAMASGPRSIKIGVQDNLAPYTHYYSASFAITTTWQQYTTSFVAPATNGNTLLNFSFAAEAGQVWLDDVVFAGP